MAPLLPTSGLSGGQESASLCQTGLMASSTQPQDYDLKSQVTSQAAAFVSRSSRNPLHLLEAVHRARVLPPADPGLCLRRDIPVDQRAPRLSLGRLRNLVSVFISS